MASKPRIAVYPGTFDPITLGHLDVLKRGSRLFDRVILAVAPSDSKNPWFSLEERLSMAREATKKMGNIEVAVLEGLTVEFAEKHQAIAIIRGLRKFSDFEFEFDRDSKFENTCIYACSFAVTHDTCKHASTYGHSRTCF